MQTHELKTEQGVFIIQHHIDKSVVFFVEDLTGEIGTLTEEYSKTLKHSLVNTERSYYSLIEATKALFCTASTNEKVNKMSRSGQPIQDMVYRYTFRNIEQEKDDFVSGLLEEGRMYYRLENRSVITVCRPLLGFEKKDDEFKARRFEVEKNFWLKKLNDNKIGEDYKILARIMIPLFE